MVATPISVLVNACTMPEEATGIGVYAYELAAALARRDDCEVTFASTRPAPCGAASLLPPASLAEGARRFSAIRLQLWTQFAVPGLLKRHDIDVYHGTEFTVPIASRRPRVATVHDLAFVTAPRLFHGWSTKVYFRLMMDTARTATCVVVPSEHVAGEVMREFGVSSRRIHVVPLAAPASMRPASPAECAEVSTRLRLVRPYILCVGIWNRNKRIVDALRAIAVLRDRGVHVDLALTGKPAPYMSRHYDREVARLGIADRVHFLGHVADRDLPGLYTGSTALVFVSELEGFGLPPMEAMTCGTPAIVSSIPVLREHCEGAALMVPRREASAVADAVETLLRSPDARAEWIGRGTERAAMYSWDLTAARTMAVYRTIL